MPSVKSVSVYLIFEVKGQVGGVKKRKALLVLHKAIKFN